MSDLKAKTVTAIKWSYFSLFVGIALQLVFSAVLARLLSPHAFGVVAPAMALQRLGLFITDLGIGLALIQRPNLSERDVRAAFTMAMLLGAVATALGWLLAPFAGQLAHNDEVTAVVRGYACTYLLSASIIVSTSLLRRDLKFRPLVIAELTSYIVGHGVIGLGAAALGYGAMSLPISALAQAGIQATIAYAYSRHSLRLTIRRDDFHGIISFSSKITVVNFLDYLSNNLDTFLASRWFDSSAVGLYNRAFNTVTVPSQNFARSLTRVLAPSFSAIQTDAARLQSAYLSALRALAVIMFAAAAGIFVCAREIVLVMLGAQFIGATPIVQAFALFMPFAVLSGLSAVLAEATARLRARMLIQAVYFVILLGAFALVFALGGDVLSFAWVLVAASVVRSLAFEWVARRILGDGTRHIIGSYAWGGASGLLMGAVLWMVAAVSRASGVPPFALFALEGAVGGLVLGALVLFGPPNELQHMLRGALRRVPARLRSARSSD
ncbi:lipopolysaccharide biosynthesis protein [Deinococcus yavapaiensis]|uniref:O-antigen/teichoic acid export membrane protein n=1 Tax=Deinococcus yavapaiensis KR-236 TaxID=694435 RepID=A0A318SDZ3_9DEIO|nr:lipopolysaccharide biosynthesis protein [Deinococcus yavapaiensis]PYE55758.1 O-antigen/teichoic acid export membrane protein [Deinococcus yavapaiensis KR-236]